MPNGSKKRDRLAAIENSIAEKIAYPEKAISEQYRYSSLAMALLSYYNYL
jgi:hypothetical protein